MLRRTVAEDRVVVSHDHDFGTLAVLAGEPIIGIVYLRPDTSTRRLPRQRSK
jgi:predicted nuclease of predicted toxin-antitoxin system